MMLTLQNAPRCRASLLGLFLLISVWFQSVTPCPEMAQLYHRYELTAYFKGENYSIATWIRPNSAPTVVICSPLSSCSGDFGYDAVANTSQSTLTVDSVELHDIGNWRIKGTVPGSTIITDVCQLMAFKQPTCSISTNLDTDDLVVGDNLLLTVTITGYYCTLQHSFNLTTGGVTEILYQKDSETGIANHTADTTINVTDSHFGRVTLNFFCEDSPFDLTCTGVDELKERIPTTTTTTTTTATTTATTETIRIPTTTTTTATTTATTTTTTETITTPIQELPSEHSDYPYLGIGVAVGIAVMLLLDGVCILGLYLKRRSDKRSSSRSAETEARQTQRENHELSNNHYDGLQGRIVDVRSGYGCLRPHGDDYINPIAGENHDLSKNHCEGLQGRTADNRLDCGCARHQ